MIAVEIAGDKNATKKLLGEMGVPVPKGFRIRDEDEIEDAIETVGFPVVVKPLDGNHGKGATVGIDDIWKRLATAFKTRKEYSRRVIVEQNARSAKIFARSSSTINSSPSPSELPRTSSATAKARFAQLIDKDEQRPAPRLRARKRSDADRHRRRRPKSF